GSQIRSRLRRFAPSNDLIPTQNHLTITTASVLISISVDHPSRKPLRVRLIFGTDSQLVPKIRQSHAPEAL
ncbi:hypothetical protein, partial [Salinibacter ruber]|uniref:hypothetical protein n=1 Tax=Salinibacter ruber TaxID=146919 RepID=UPI002169B3A5